MAKYSDIKGFTVQTLSSDTAASQAATGSWSSGGSLNEGRVELRGAGSQTSALIFGGDDSPVVAITEEYNGTAYTEVNDLNTARSLLGGAGANAEACLAFGGQVSGGGLPQATEVWNGSSWTEVNEMNTGREGIADNGISTAALASGGKNPSSTSLDVVESWNGTNWTEVAEINTGRRLFGGVGTYTDAVVYSGLGPSTNTETWNGSSWTEVAEVNTSRYNFQGFGDSSSSAFFTGGYTGSGNSAANEFWNGTSWTEVADLSDSGNGFGAAGSSSAGLISGGNGRSPNAVTEEFTATPSDEFVQIQEGQLFFNSTTNTFKETITDLPGATWASGASINDGRNAVGSAGTTTAALLFTGDPVSGSPDGVSANTEKYDGSSWTEVNNTNTARRECFYGCGLTNTAALCAGGYDGSAKTANAETWDGTNWTEVANLNQTRNAGALVGSSTAAIGFGGMQPPYTGKTEFWNGSTWTELADLNTSRYTLTGAGPSYTAALAFGGYGTTYDAETEEWNGTSWTEVSDLNTARYGIGATVSASSLSSILAFGGDESPPANNKTEFWNGSSWSELAEISTARYQGGGAGTSGTGALFFGGAPNPVGTTTEEWTASLANKTITTS